MATVLIKQQLIKEYFTTSANCKLGMVTCQSNYKDTIYHHDTLADSNMHTGKTKYKNLSVMHIIMIIPSKITIAHTYTYSHTQSHLTHSLVHNAYS